MTRDHDTADPEVPAAIAARVVRAVDRSPTSIFTLVDADLTIAWMSGSASWIAGTDPTTRAGASAFERIHPDDAERLLYGLAQIKAAMPIDAPTVPVAGPIRYRLKRADGRWVVVESLVHNLLDDPEVAGMLVESRPVDGGLDGIGHVVDLLVDDAPLPDVLAGCARLVPRHLGSAAVVAFVGGDPAVAVVGVPDDSPAGGLADDARWWRAAVASGGPHAPTDFAGFPDDLAEKARLEGFRTAWMLPLGEPSSTEVVGCVAVWVRIGVPPDMALDESLRQVRRLAGLVIAEERRRLALRRQATTDPLTGLQNRSALRRRLDDAPGAVTLAILDLDDFKPVNDTHGHDAGDLVLQAVATRLTKTVRADDLVVRFGGDEFAVVFADETTPVRAAQLADRIARAIGAPVAIDPDRTVTVTACVGLATAPADLVVREADAALYAAKKRRG
jgi:diguanylate cyclase (GGDEF)-like protein